MMSLFCNFKMLIVASVVAGMGALTFARPLQAQQTTAPSGGTITLDDAIGLALKQNATVLQAQNAVDLSDADVKQQKMQLMPDLKLSLSGADNVGRNFSQADGAIVNAQTQSLSSGLSSSLTLFDGGKTRASIRSAQSSSDASASDLSRAKQTAVFTVASDFVALTNQDEQLRVQQENLTAQQAQQDLIQKLVNAGTRPVSDLYQQQATVASAKLAIAQASRAVELAKVDLIQALQLNPGGTYNFVAPVVSVADTTKTYDLNDLLDRAYANRKDLDAQQSRVEAAGQDVKAAGAAKLPTVSVTGGYSSAFSSASDIGFSDQLDQRRGGSIGLGVSIPLFDRGAASAAEQRAEIAAENARLSLDTQRQTIALEVRRAYLDQISAKEQLSAAQAQLSAAQLAVQMTEQRYQAGAATLVEVTQVRSQQVQAASAVATAKNNLVLQQAVMTYYTGELDPAQMKLG
ncbi:MAG TPA: TolC family protein [Gemmatimonadaceae bacterium]